MTNRTRDIFYSLLFLVIGILLFQQSLKIVPIMEKDIGSGFMPKLIAISLILISLIKLILTFLHKESEEKAKEDLDNMGGILTIGALLFYVLTFEILGFIFSTAIYLFLQITILSNEKNRRLFLFLGISVGVSITIYMLFVYVINRPLPVGILGF